MSEHSKADGSKKSRGLVEIMRERQKKVDAVPLPKRFSVDVIGKEFERELAGIADYCRGVDVLNICYHGTGQSVNFSHELADDDSLLVSYGIFRKGIKAAHLGILPLRSRIPMRFWEKSDEVTRAARKPIVDAIAEALSQAPRISILTESGHLNLVFEKELLAAIEEKAKGRVFHDANIDAAERLRLAADLKK